MTSQVFSFLFTNTMHNKCYYLLAFKKIQNLISSFNIGDIMALSKSQWDTLIIIDIWWAQNDLFIPNKYRWTSWPPDCWNWGWNREIGCVWWVRIRWNGKSHCWRRSKPVWLQWEYIYFNRTRSNRLKIFWRVIIFFVLFCFFALGKHKSVVHEKRTPSLSE